MRLTCLAGWISLIALLPRDGVAGDICGTVYLSHRAERLGHNLPDPAYAPLQRGVRDAVVYITNIPVATDHTLRRRARSGTIRLAQSRHRFTPRVTVVVAGSNIEFANLDSLYHGPFSVSTARRCDSISPAW
jgi:hypothetical protein